MTSFWWLLLRANVIFPQFPNWKNYWGVSCKALYHHSTGLIINNSTDWLYSRITLKLSVISIWRSRVQNNCWRTTEYCILPDSERSHYKAEACIYIQNNLGLIFGLFFFFFWPKEKLTADDVLKGSHLLVSDGKANFSISEICCQKL